MYTDRRDLTATASSVICEKHFYEDARSYGKQRASLKWNPIPTKRGPHCGKRQLNEVNVELWRKLSKIMNVDKAGQYLNTLYLNTVFKYIYCIYTLYLNTFFNLYLITVFKYF